MARCLEIQKRFSLGQTTAYLEDAPAIRAKLRELGSENQDTILDSQRELVWSYQDRVLQQFSQQYAENLNDDTFRNLKWSVVMLYRLEFPEQFSANCDCDDIMESNFLYCDVCWQLFHLPCLESTLPGIPLGDWYCPACERAGNQNSFLITGEGTYTSSEAEGQPQYVEDYLGVNDPNQNFTIAKDPTVGERIADIMSQQLPGRRNKDTSIPRPPLLKKDWDYYKSTDNKWNHVELIPPHRKKLVFRPKLEKRARAMEQQRDQATLASSVQHLEAVQFHRDVARQRARERTAERAVLELKSGVRPTESTLRSAHGATFGSVAGVLPNRSDDDLASTMRSNASSVYASSVRMNSTWKSLTDDMSASPNRKTWKHYHLDGPEWSQKRLELAPARKRDLVLNPAGDSKAIAMIENRRSEQQAGEDWHQSFLEMRREDTMSALRHRRAKRIYFEQSYGSYFQRLNPSQDHIDNRWEGGDRNVYTNAYIPGAMSSGKPSRHAHCMTHSDAVGLQRNYDGGQDDALYSSSTLSLPSIMSARGEQRTHSAEASRTKAEEDDPCSQLDEFDDKMKLSLRPRLDRPPLMQL